MSEEVELGDAEAKQRVRDILALVENQWQPADDWTVTMMEAAWLEGYTTALFRERGLPDETVIEYALNRRGEAHALGRSCGNSVRAGNAGVFMGSDVMSDELQAIFTTGDVARICHVGQRTAQRWCDLEYLPSHRILGGNRRIKREHLIRFMKEHGMPLGELEDE